MTAKAAYFSTRNPKHFSPTDDRPPVDDVEVRSHSLTIDAFERG